MKRYLILAVLLLTAFSCGKDNPREETGQYTLRQQRSEKRGVSYNFGTFPSQEIDLLGPGTSWSYDWSNRIPSDERLNGFARQRMDWIPMIWNNNYSADNIRCWKQTHPEAQYILAYNEPNLTDQANMTPSQAAEKWPEIVSLAKELGMKLISPAMNYGTLDGYHDPYKWLDEFFAQPGVSLDDVDGIACHCYMGSASAVKSFLDGFKKYGKPLWLTEFCIGNNTTAQAHQMYMSQTLNMLEGNPDVARYAWFIPYGDKFLPWHNNLLTLDKATKSFVLTDLGKVFVNMSTFDKSIFYKADEVIPAEQYAEASGYLLLAPSTDGGVLDIADLGTGGRASYQLDLAEGGVYSLTLRYACESDAGAVFSCGETELGRKKLPSTGGQWRTGSFEVTLPAGKSVLSVEGTTTPGIRLNWMKITK